MGKVIEYYCILFQDIRAIVSEKLSMIRKEQEKSEMNFVRGVSIVFSIPSYYGVMSGVYSSF